MGYDSVDKLQNLLVLEFVNNEITYNVEEDFIVAQSSAQNKLCAIGWLVNLMKYLEKIQEIMT